MTKRRLKQTPAARKRRAAYRRRKRGGFLGIGKLYQKFKAAVTSKTGRNLLGDVFQAVGTHYTKGSGLKRRKPIRRRPKRTRRSTLQLAF